jgi:hypothetical protein
LPEQTIPFDGLEVMLKDGLALTVIVAVAVFWQPLLSVPVTV